MPNCQEPAPPSEDAYRGLESRLRQIADEVRRRAPLARFVILQYPTMLPLSGACANVPLDREEAERVRSMGRRLAEITGRIARAASISVLDVDRLSRGHDACSNNPWVNGYSTPNSGDGVLYHPNRAGMAAQARSLEQLVWGKAAGRH